ncbi:MAG: hypothetical protein KAH84_08050 [Thiomargarita sp.]|nr:hypothetical protein [Thiomargarita sp.]
MNNLYRFFITLIGIMLCTTSLSATLIKRNTQNGVEKVIIDGKQIRMQSKNPNYYSLIFLDKGKTYSVDKKKKRIVEMDIEGKPPTQANKPKTPPWGNEVNSKLVNKGTGAKIAGYITVRYQIQAMGKPCADYYFSDKLAEKIPYIKDFINASTRITESRKVKGAYFHPCQQAQSELVSQIRAKGIPMKFVLKGAGNSTDKVVYEVINIEKVNVPADTFILPSKYKKITEKKVLQERNKRMKLWMQQNKQNHNYAPPNNR